MEYFENSDKLCNFLGYDVPTLTANLDWIALMAYDYHGQWEKKTGHVAPMYAHEDDDDQTFNAVSILLVIGAITKLYKKRKCKINCINCLFYRQNFTVHYWLQKGATREKLVMGLPFYGQSFSLAENTGTGLGVPTSAGGEPGDETRARGFLAFYEVKKQDYTKMEISHYYK